MNKKTTSHDTNSRGASISAFSRPLRVALVSFFLPLAAAAELPTEPPPVEPPPEATRSRTGLVSMVIQEGTGKANPDRNDMAVTNYAAYDANGVLFQTNRDTGTPMFFHIETVFPGFQEGLQQMVSGETRRLWIPAHLGPKNPKSGPRGASIIDVELLAFRKLPNPPPSPDPSDRATSHSGGAHSEVTRHGTGNETPEADGAVLVHYTGWTRDQKEFDSSVRRGKPTAFLLNTVMPALGNVLGEMVVGEKRYIWIPEELAQGNWIGSPRGDLVFEIEVLGLIPASAFQNPPPEGSSPATDG